MSRVTVIEDNGDLREEVVFHLRHAGHDALGVADGPSLDHSLATGRIPDVVVLDIGLPGEDGFSIAARLRRDHPETGIVILSARGLIDDKLHGLSLGADAYLVKPVDLRELIAVVASVGRRVAGRNGAWQLDTTRREVISPAGAAASLTHTEYLLMLQLAQAAPEVASRRALVEALGHDFMQFDERRIEAAISRLRKKLQGDGENSPLRSARTQGYVFAAPIRIVSH
ncbi:MAG: response regulator transcription factor [Pseudomonadota bacterium]